MTVRMTSLFTLMLLGASAMSAQDTTHAADSARAQARGVLPRAKSLARRGTAAVRNIERAVFNADSLVERWTMRHDATSLALRRLSPVAFWVPVAAVVTAPIVWADETDDRNHMNAQYAASETAALAMGFIVSRTAKKFVHRARPCSGGSPSDVTFESPSDSVRRCARSFVSGNASFFSEHTMALFAIASAASFQAQRRNAPNATSVTAASFTTAAVLSLGRIYQQQHWFSDVIVGAAVGTGAGFLAAQLGPAKRRP